MDPGSRRLLRTAGLSLAVGLIAIGLFALSRVPPTDPRRDEMLAHSQEPVEVRRLAGDPAPETPAVLTTSDVRPSADGRVDEFLTVVEDGLEERIFAKYALVLVAGTVTAFAWMWIRGPRPRPLPRAKREPA